MPLDLLAMLFLMQPKTLLAFFAARAHCWLMFNFWCPPGPQGPFLPSCFPAGCPHHTLVHGVVLPQVQDLAFPLVELQEVPVSLFLPPLPMPLNGSTTACCINHYSQFCIICRLAEGTLCPIVQVIYEDVKQCQSYYQPQSPLVNGFQLNFIPPFISLCAWHFSWFSDTGSDGFPLRTGWQPSLDNLLDLLD